MRMAKLFGNRHISVHLFYKLPKYLILLTTQQKQQKHQTTICSAWSSPPPADTGGCGISKQQAPYYDLHHPLHDAITTDARNKRTRAIRTSAIVNMILRTNARNGATRTNQSSTIVTTRSPPSPEPSGRTACPLVETRHQMRNERSTSNATPDDEERIQWPPVIVIPSVPGNRITITNYHYNDLENVSIGFSAAIQPEELENDFALCLTIMFVCLLPAATGYVIVILT
ncbi:hypothetical protein BX666DRAFT_2032657 [Dichotomocladium elegans]|nr:hypothetical protein BX666DRAFT_2032657 [Dichotomocladium elegans]